MKPSLNWLLAMVPACILLDHFAPGQRSLVFFMSAAAVVPLAGWLGQATERLAARTSQGLGGLMNATFGNAAELIIALFALREGLAGVVKASLTGSIIGNLLLVLGASVLAGGLRFKVQRFNEAAARVRATMLTLAAIALVLPAAFHHLAGRRAEALETGLSVQFAVVLLLSYALGLLFSLRTHRQYFLGHAPPQGEERKSDWSPRKSVAVLAASTAAIGWVSEILAGSVTGAAHAMGMSSVFVGVVVLGIVGNAAEHATAVMAARNNHMDLAVGIAIGSSIQIALFVAPALVLASFLIGPAPMDLVFSPAEVLAIVLAVWIAGQISGDGESNWMEGVQLLAVYVVLAVTFFFLPGS